MVALSSNLLASNGQPEAGDNACDKAANPLSFEYQNVPPEVQPEDDQLEVADTIVMQLRRRPSMIMTGVFVFLALCAMIRSEPLWFPLGANKLGTSMVSLAEESGQAKFSCHKADVCHLSKDDTSIDANGTATVKLLSLSGCMDACLDDPNCTAYEAARPQWGSTDEYRCELHTANVSNFQASVYGEMEGPFHDFACCLKGDRAYAKPLEDIQVYVPNGSVAADAPLVIVLAGGGQLGQSYAKQGLLSGIGDKHGFVLVYPTAFHPPTKKPCWHAGYTPHFPEDVDAECAILTDRDMKDGVIQQTMEIVKSKTGVVYNPRLIFATGMSNGGDMTELLAYRGLVDAVALACPALPVKRYDSAGPARPMPVAIFHGWEDDQTFFAGGRDVSYFPYVSAEENAKFWAKANGFDGIKPKKIEANITKDQVEDHIVEWEAPGKDPVIGHWFSHTGHVLWYEFSKPNYVIEASGDFFAEQAARLK